MIVFQQYNIKIQLLKTSNNKQKIIENIKKNLEC